MNFKKNQVINVLIEETNMMGFGVVKKDNVVIFVQNGVEGDHCDIKIIKCAKNYCVARIENLHVASNKRIEPICKHFRRCGGCAFQHVSYEHEKQLKQKSVEGFLLKEGLSDIPVLPILSTNKTLEYRNKAQFPVATDDDGNVICGFYAPKTHRVCPLDSCSIQHPVFNLIAKKVCDFLTNQKIPPYSELDQTGLVRHIYLRIAQETGEIMLCLVLKENCFPWKDEFVKEMVDSFPEIASVCLNVQPKNNNVILGNETIVLFGSEKITDIFCGRKLMISPLSFYQVNHDAAELLYRTAFDMAGLTRFDHIIDLYCGIGSISISTYASCPITGVEIVPEAIKDANENAELNGILGSEYICGDAADAFHLMDEIGAKNPLLIVDPPRKGLSRELIEQICENGIRSVLYISCGPDTFARDLSVFREKGYSISAVQPVDLFPRTSHVENIAFLCRDNIVHHMKLYPAPFEMIKSGKKTIELRLLDEKRKKIKIGDQIVFECVQSGERLCAEVLQLRPFNTFEELYASLPLDRCGYTSDTVKNASASDMNEFYTKEQISKYGVVGIEIKLV